MAATLSRRTRLRRRLEALPPPAVLALLYLGLILLGAVILWLPVSNTGGIGIGAALFTSTSAVTVTGLVVADTGSAFTGFGQAVIAVLIQCGGLGLMTFAVLVLSTLGIPVGLPGRAMLREDLSQTSFSNLMTLVRVILTVALLCEAAGTLILATVFVPELGWGPGLWSAAFHTISAFNNAGFSLYPDSLSAWVGHPLVNIAVPAMFILGGLGFVVLGDIVQARRWRRLSLHSKIMLAGTGLLIGLSWPGFALLEWTNPATLGGLDTTWDRICASWFQAVTPRTAGFNTVDTGGMHDATTLMTMTLMLIGGGSASTAGGIKVTTLCVLILATIAFFRRGTELHIFGRSLGIEAVLRVLAITTVSLFAVLAAIFAASITHEGDFLDLAFEMTSAFGTVGLSRGATAELDTAGHAILMALMFLGRVGPLTLGFFLATRMVPRVRYPQGDIYLG